MDNFLILSLVIVIVLSSCLEFIFRVKWTPFYFNHGLVIYKKSFMIKENKKLDLQLLENEMGKSQILYPNMFFREQPDGKIFFREQIVHFRVLVPIMHGLIIKKHDFITVIGRINWYIYLWLLLFPLFLMIVNQGVKEGNVPILFLIFGLLMIITFGIIIPFFTNVNRYNKLVSLIQSQLGVK